MKHEADAKEEVAPSTPEAAEVQTRAEGEEDEADEFLARDFRSTLGSMQVNWSSCLMILVLAAIVVAIFVFARG